MQSLHVDVVDSTNEQAKRLVASGDISGRAFVAAREQTNGKGSHGRAWVSPRDGGIYLSVIDAPAEPIDCRQVSITDFTLAAGVACVEAIADSLGLVVQLKPINDLYVDAGKLGGILTELVIEAGRARAVIVGIGINVRSAERPLPPGHVVAACLDECLGRRVSEAELVTLRWNVVQLVFRWIDRIAAGNDREVRGEWRRYARPGAVLPV